MQSFLQTISVMEAIGQSVQYKTGILVAFLEIIGKLRDEVADKQRFQDMEIASTTFTGTDSIVKCAPPRLTRPLRILSDPGSLKEPCCSCSHRRS